MLPLRPDRPSAAEVPVQPDVIEMLESLLSEVRSGKITAVAMVAYDQFGHFKCGVTGKATYTAFVGGLSDLIFEIQLTQRKDPHAR